MSIRLKKKEKRKMAVGGINFQLRVQPNWWWGHFMIPVVLFLINIFRSGYRENFMRRNHAVSFLKRVIYIDTGAHISSSGLMHQVIRLQQTNGLKKKITYFIDHVSEPRKRFSHKLEAYTVEFKAVLDNKGHIPGRTRIKYARIMSDEARVPFEFSLEETNKVCDQLENKK